MCLTLAWTTGCGPTATPEVAATALCGVPPDTATAAPAYKAPPARLGLRVVASKQRLLKELSARVPRMLAQGKGKAIGVAGKATYSIMREDLQLDIGREDATVSTRLNGQIRVCKPVGPFCPQYGRCSPRWNARFSLPTRWSLAKPPSIRGEVAIAQGCVLRPVGYDATDELRRITKRQARMIRQRINRQLAQAHRLFVTRLEQASTWHEGETCLGFQPTLGRYSIDADESTLTFAAELEGVLGNECSPTYATPKLVPADQLQPKTLLELSEALPLAELAAQLQEQSGTAVELGTELQGNAGQLKIGVALKDSPCRLTWAQVNPLVQGQNLQLTAASETAPPELRRWLATHGQVKIQQSVAKLDEEIELIRTRLGSIAKSTEKEEGLRLQLELATMRDFRIAADKLVLVYQLAGTSKATLN